MGKKMTLFFPLVLLLLVGLLAGMVFAKDPTVRQSPLDTIQTCGTNEYATLTYQGIECKNKTDTWTNECDTPTNCCSSGEFLKITPTGIDCFPFSNKTSTYTTYCADCCWKSEFAVITTLGLRCAGESCNTDSDCSSPTPYCNTTIGRCVPCTQDSHCSGSNNFCSPTNKCEQCTWDTNYTCSNNKRVKYCRLSDGTIKKTQTLSCPNSGTCSNGQCVCTPVTASWGTAPACSSPSSVQCGTTIQNTTASCSYGRTANCTSTSCPGSAPTRTCSGKGTKCATGTCTNNSCYVAPQQCTGGTVSWTVGSHTCSGSRATTNSGSSATVSNTTSGKTGSATYSCTGTTWGSATNTTCAASNTCTNASKPAALIATPGLAQCTITENDAGNTYRYRIKKGLGSWVLIHTVSGLGHTHTFTGLTNNTAYTFYMQRRNSSGNCTTWSSSTSVSCTPTTSVTQQCTGGTVSWTVGSHTCSGTRSTTNSGSSDTVSNTTSGKTGSATYRCNGTAWGGATNTTCAPQQCTGGGTVSWTVGSHTCSGTRSTTNSGSSDTVSNTTSGKTGSATYSCTGTSWGSATNATCAATDTHGQCKCPLPTGSSKPSDSAGCSSGVVTSYNANASPNGDRWVCQGSSSSETCIRCSGGATQPPTFTVTAGNKKLTATGLPTSSTYQYRTRLSTNSSCDGGSWRWSNWGTLASSIEYSSTTGYTLSNGTTYYVCLQRKYNAGCHAKSASRAVSGTPTGVTPCTGGTVSWTVSGNTCSGTRSETDSGSSDTVSNTTSGKTGSATYSCTGTTWGSATNATCCKKSTPPTAPTVTPGNKQCTVTPATSPTNHTCQYKFGTGGWLQFSQTTFTGLTNGTAYTVLGRCISSVSGSCGYSDIVTTTCTLASGSCSATTKSNCDLSATSHNGTSGTCASGYTGSCSYTCNNGTWGTPSSNTCTLSCTNASAPTVSSITAGNAQCTITLTTPETSKYTYYYKKTATDTQTEATITNNQFTITGLTNGDAYSSIKVGRKNSTGTCDTIAWISAPSCTPVADPCSATFKGYCRLDWKPHGDSSGVCAYRSTGSCKYTCDNGSWVRNSSSCVAPSPECSTTEACHCDVGSRSGKISYSKDNCPTSDSDRVLGTTYYWECISSDTYGVECSGQYGGTCVDSNIVYGQCSVGTKGTATCNASGSPGTEGNMEYTCSSYGGTENCTGVKCCVAGSVWSCSDGDTQKRTMYDDICNVTEKEWDCTGNKVCVNGDCQSPDI